MDFELAAWLDPNLVPVIRRCVEKAYERTLDADATSRIAMTTHELLENAVKYSTEGPMRLVISVRGKGDVRQVAIRVVNRAKESELEALRLAIGEIECASDPKLFYQALLRGAARKTEGSGLGLARIRSEGEMRLSVECAGGEVSICARGSVEIRGQR